MRLDIDIEGYWHITILYNIYIGQINSGFTHTDYTKKWSIVVIGICDSKEEFINTISHEAKHLVTHICKYFNVKEDTEQAAYLMGYIVQRMYKVFRYYL